jgi:Uma2 family endonuclease
MSPSGFKHGDIAGYVAGLLHVWNLQHKFGRVLVADPGFRLQRDPDLVRAPDVALVQANRIGDETPTGFFEGPPDLVVEVVSPNDSWPEVESKVEMWLAHGCQSCWVVDPKNRAISLYRKDGTIVKLRETQTLEDPLLPGFITPVAAVFAR